MMKNKELHTLAQLAAKNIKAENVLNDFRQMWIKLRLKRRGINPKEI